MAAPAPEPSKWADLRPRALSAAGMIVVGSASVVAGGVWFQMLTVFVVAVIVWELWMMIEPRRPQSGMLLAALVASVLSGGLAVQEPWGALLFLIAPLAGLWGIRRERAMWFAFSLGVQVAGWGLVIARAESGFAWILWLIGVVVATDVGGYFAGRLIGGPKFWPRVSPKKTWAGTVAGWVLAALVGLVFDLFTRVEAEIVPLSVLLSIASQWGDISKSVLKRRMGVKDSSNLIPGHGGMLDRFDAMLGASLFMLALSVAFGDPGLVF